MATYSFGSGYDWDKFEESLDVTNPWNNDSNWSLDNSGGKNIYGLAKPNTDKGYFDKLLDGDTGALGLAGLGMKGVGLAAQLAMLPGAMETAKLQNDGLKLAVEEAKKDSANKAAIRQQLSSISV